MSKKITKWNEIIGNPNQKEIILNAICRKSLPSFILFTGSSGIGKSTFAKMTAKTLLCENLQETGEPCGLCDECRSIEDGSSKSYIKENMPQLFKKVDVDKKIEEIFKIQKIKDKTVYVLEEVHGLTRELQTLLLEELTKIPKDVWIISCTTRPYELLPEILNRAVEFKLQDPSSKECEGFAKKIANEFGILVQEPEVIKKLVERCECCPRKISEIIRVVALDNKLTEESLNKMFSSVGPEHVIMLLESMAEEDDLFNVIANLQKMQDSSSLYQITRKTVDTLYEYVLACVGGVDLNKTSIKKEVADTLCRLFRGTNKNKLVAIINILGSAELREHESASSQKSKLITVKRKIDSVLAKELGVEESKAPMKIKERAREKGKTSEFISSEPITSVSELDSILVQEGLSDV